MAPFYRSIATCLTFGMTGPGHPHGPVREGDRPVVGRAADAGPLRERGATTSCPVARRSRRRCCTRSGSRSRRRSGGPARSRSPRWARAASNQGDVHEGLNFAAIHKLPFILCVENNGYAISVPVSQAARGPGRGDARLRLRDPGRDRRRRGRARLLSRGEGGGGPGPARRRPDAHRGQGHPPDRALVRRPADEIPLRRGARGPQGRGSAAALPCRARATPAS